MDGIRRLGPAFGIELNPAKCELIGAPSEHAATAAAFGGTCKSVDWASWTLLGTPCGDDASVSAFLQRVADNACRKTRLVASLPDKHVTYALLRYCCGFSLGVYYMRACGADKAFDRIDESTFAAFATLIPGVTELNRAQIGLPTSLGGIGLRPLSPYAPLAYIAACKQAEISFPHLLTSPSSLPADPKLSVAANSPTVISSPALSVSVTEYLRTGATSGDRMQRELSKMLDAELAKAWFLTLSTEDQARAMSCTMPTSYCWALPRPFEDEVESWMTAAQFLVLMRHRLGLLIYAEPDDGEPRRLCRLCGKVAIDARHALICLSGGLRTALHNDLRDLLYRIGSTAMLGPRREEQCFVGGMRADVVFTNARRVMAIDVAITGVDSGREYAVDASKPGAASDMYARKKFTTYGAAAAAAGVDFVPLVFDTFGALNVEGVKLLRFVARAWGYQFDIVPARSVPLINQRFSAVLNRGLAQLLIANAASG